MKITLESVTLDEVLAVKTAMSRWHEPHAFEATYRALKERLQTWEFFGVPALAFMREAWTMSKYAALVEADKVRLETESFPDGHIMKDDRSFAIEVTEALMPSRRRAQEFLPGTPALTEDPGEEWNRRLDALPAALAASIVRKAGKRYSPPPILLIYLNITAYGHRDREMKAQIERLVAQSDYVFGGIQVIWQGELYGTSTLPAAGSFRST